MNVDIQLCVCVFFCGSVWGGGLLCGSRQSFDVAMTGNALWLCEPSRHSHPHRLWSLQRPIFTPLPLSLSLLLHTPSKHTEIYLDINLLYPPPFLLNWRPSSWSGLKHCADGHKITNLTDALGLFMDELCSVVMFILLSNFIVLSSLFLPLQLSLFSPSRSVLLFLVLAFPALPPFSFSEFAQTDWQWSEKIFDMIYHVLVGIICVHLFVWKQPSALSFFNILIFIAFCLDFFSRNIYSECRLNSPNALLIFSISLKVLEALETVFGKQKFICLPRLLFISIFFISTC